MKKRMWILYGLVFVVAGGLVFRIYTLSDKYLARAANEQSKVSVTVANTRGTFYDRNLQPFVNEITEYRASVTPNEKAVAALSKVLSKQDFTDMSEILKIGRPAVVKLEKLAAAEEGITLFQVPIRYSERVLAPHLIGYMNADQTEGLTGLEAAFDTILSSYNGTASVSYTVDAKGNPLNGIFPVITDTTKTSKGGVLLTLDAEIQRETEDIAAKYIKKGAVIVMQPQTGEILSMVSLPTFQPQTVADVLESTDAPLLNRALCRYNCGSVFKIVTAATALEKGVSKDVTYNCAGKIQVGDTNFHCHNRLGHGLLNMKNAFAKSCNCYFIQLMNQSGGEALWRLAYRLEFNNKLNLCDGISTEIGILPDVQSLQSPAVLANFSFGQGELTATPLHIAQLIGTVVNDGKLVTPKLIKGYVDEEENVNEISFSSTVGQQVFSAETASCLRDMMQAVVSEDGTGFSGKPTYGDAGAKTGTAETGWEKGENEQYDVVHSWYAGFYPVNEPKYVIVVLAENAENTDAKTATVFKKIADILYQLKLKTAE